MVGLILVAAGQGERLGAGVPKALVELAGKPLVVHAAERAVAAGIFEEAVVVAPRAALDRFEALLPKKGPPRWRTTAGGRLRQDSVRYGLRALGAAVDFVAVHDAARPLASADLFRRTVEVATAQGAAIAALPLFETIHEIDEASGIVSSPDRERLWRAQTPQAFRADWLREAHDRARADRVRATDDAGLLRRIGYPVRVVVGEESNLKITTMPDLRFASAWLRARE